MKYKCIGCGATYIHNHFILPAPKVCRFCGKEMVKDTMTKKDWKLLLNPNGGENERKRD